MLRPVGIAEEATRNAHRRCPSTGSWPVV